MKKLLLLLVLLNISCSSSDADKTSEDSAFMARKRQLKEDSQRARHIIYLKKCLYSDSLVFLNVHYKKAWKLADSVYSNYPPPYNQSHESLIKEERVLKRRDRASENRFGD